MAPSRQRGGAISARSTTPGLPSAPRVDTSASPTASSAIARAVSMRGLGRNVSAAARTACWSLGVKARHPLGDLGVLAGGLAEPRRAFPHGPHSLPIHQFDTIQWHVADAGMPPPARV
jgi:hypothetical protein